MTKKPSSARSWTEYLKISFAGLAMGVANVIPGVSGGTMAFIMGVFEELLDAIEQFTSPHTIRLLLKFKVKELYQTLPWRFLLALGVGVLIAFAGVSKLFVWLVDNRPDYTFAFFFGLILGSVLIVGKMVKKWNIPVVVSLIVGGIAAYQIIMLAPVTDPSHAWYVTVFCGMIAMCAMILPGISGSFLLLILGQYQLVWNAVGDFSTGNFSAEGGKTLLLLGVGCVIGITFFVRLLKFFFGRWHDATVASLIGFMLGSLPRLWPWQQVTEVAIDPKGKLVPVKIAFRGPDYCGFGGKFFLIAGLMVLGLAIVIAIESVAGKKSKKTK